MSITLGLNIASLRAQQQLRQHGDALGLVFERLSSGQRINRASDDPVGLMIATELQAEGRVLSQAVRNVNDGLSYLSIAEAALEELSAIATRQMELAQQAGNGTYTQEQRDVLQLEANTLVDEYNRIIESTEFNGTKILNTPNSTTTIQAGSGANSTIDFILGTELARSVGSGSFTPGATQTIGNAPYAVELIDLNGDGILDFINSDNGADNIEVLLGNGDGTFNNRSTYALSSGALSLDVGDFDGNGTIDILAAESFNYFFLSGVGDGTFAAAVSTNISDIGLATKAGDFDGDGDLDFVTVRRNSDQASIFLNDGNGSFTQFATYTANGARALEVGDFNRDGNLDFVSGDADTGDVTTFLGQGDGSFILTSTVSSSPSPRYFESGDFNLDGITDLAVTNQGFNEVTIFQGDGDGNFTVTQTLTGLITPTGIDSGDLNGDGNDDLVVATRGAQQGATILYSNGDGTFTNGGVISTGDVTPYAEVGDLDGDGILDIAAATYGAGQLEVYLAGSSEASTIPYVSFVDAESRSAAISTFEQVLSNATSELGSIGAAQSRFSFTLSNLISRRENIEAAVDRIFSIDIAQETAELVRLQILQQATTAILAQANQQPSIVLQLYQSG